MGSGRVQVSGAGQQGVLIEQCVRAAEVSKGAVHWALGTCRGQPKFTELLYSLRNGWQIRSTSAADQVSFRRDFKFEQLEVNKKK